MKRIFLMSMVTALHLMWSQNTKTVSVGTNYANQVWYSLQNGIQGTGQSKDNWDLGFEISGYSASIIANTQKTNFAIYKTPFTALQWNSVDTSGIAKWGQLYNADTSWAEGALNKGKNTSNQFDLGWGVYDMNTHFVNGDSCFVVKLSATIYKKLLIENLANGIYNFVYADIDGKNETVQSIDKSKFKGKNFAYFNLLNNEVVDREPATANWDLTFTRYTAMLVSNGVVTPYPSVGVLQNNGVTVTQADNIPDLASYVAYTNHEFKTAINTIGYDWKTYAFATNSWAITKDQCYFVKDKAGNFWKLVFTGFGGTANGDFYFTQEALVTTSVNDADNIPLASFSVFPNPAVDGTLSILLSAEQTKASLEISVLNASGQVLSSNNITANQGFSKINTDISTLESGVYFVSVKGNAGISVQKFTKN